MADIRALLARRTRADDRGYTLTELLVTMSIFGLCMSVVMGALIMVLKKSDDVQQTADATSELRLALAQIDRQVRSGNVLYSPSNEATYLASCTSMMPDSGTCMRIFTQANGAEKCVQWQILDNPAAAGTKYLRTRSWSATWQSDGQFTGWSTVARNLRVNPSRDPFQLQGAATPYRERLLSVRLDAFDSRRKTTVDVESSLSGRNTTYGFNAAQCTPVPPA